MDPAWCPMRFHNGPFPPPHVSRDLGGGGGGGQSADFVSGHVTTSADPDILLLRLQLMASASAEALICLIRACHSIIPPIESMSISCGLQ